jgi:hypothetical protein
MPAGDPIVAGAWKMLKLRLECPDATLDLWVPGHRPRPRKLGENSPEKWLSISVPQSAGGR